MPIGAFRVNGLGRYNAPTGRTAATITATSVTVTNTAAAIKFGTGAAEFLGTTGQQLLVTNWDSTSVTTQFTWETWARFTNITSNSTAELYMQGVDSNTQDFHRVYAVFTGAEANRLYIAIGISGNASYLYAPFTWAANTWYHIAVTRDSSNNIRHYVNGNQIGSTQNNTRTWTSAFATDRFTIGRFRDGTSRLIGTIDDYRISNTARYTGTTYTVPTAAFTNDSNTTFLMHADGSSGSTTFTDDNA